MKAASIMRDPPTTRPRPEVRSDTRQICRDALPDRAALPAQISATKPASIVRGPRAGGGRPELYGSMRSYVSCST
jgi:hypothetical protein